MLVLSRKLGEKIVIGDNITVSVVSIDRGRVKLAFEAPYQVRILRGELAEWQTPDAPATPPDDPSCEVTATCTLEVEALPDVVVSQ